jgi:hypothetical protein
MNILPSQPQIHLSKLKSASASINLMRDDNVKSSIISSNGFHQPARCNRLTFSVHHIFVFFVYLFLVVFVGRGIQTQQLYTISFVGVTVSVPTGFKSICISFPGYPFMCWGKQIAVLRRTTDRQVFLPSLPSATAQHFIFQR